MTYVFLQNLTTADDDIMKYAIGHLALPALVASLSLFLVPLLPFSTCAILSYITLSLPLFFRFSLEGLFPPNLLYFRVAFVSLPDYLSILVCVPMYCLSFCLLECRTLFIYSKAVSSETSYLSGLSSDSPKRPPCKKVQTFAKRKGVNFRLHFGKKNKNENKINISLYRAEVLVLLQDFPPEL